MPMCLEGSCRCGAISFSVDSHTPYPYQRCYCTICRKSAGGGGYAINIMGVADTLKVKGKSVLGVWNAPIDGYKGSTDRHYCKRCGTPLWVSDEQWPELVHPFASAIDTELPTAPFERTSAAARQSELGRTPDRPQRRLLRRLSRISRSPGSRAQRPCPVSVQRSRRLFWYPQATWCGARRFLF
jgi:hypothetical protein